MYVSENDAGTKHEVHLRPSRQAYLVRECPAMRTPLPCVGGSLTVTSLQLDGGIALAVIEVATFRHRGCTCSDSFCSC